MDNIHMHLYLLFLSALAYNSNPHQDAYPNGGIIGAIVDTTSRIGKEEAVAMEMAIEDICSHTNNACPTLKVTSSHGEAAQAALAAKHLMNDKKVQVILGPRSWEETASVAAEVVNHHQSIPILSFSESSPSWGTRRWPFLFQASPSKNRQMKAIAAIVESCQWRRVNVIYEDVDSASNGITPHLYDALKEVGAQISHLIPFSPFTNDSVLSEELQKLKRQQCRVFVVHVSLSLGVRLFKSAKEMMMMEKGYVWITTDTITNLVHSLNSSTISTMQGVIGIEGYYHNEGMIKYQDFQERFEDKFGLKYPQEKSHEPGSFAVEAYDATWTVALAMEKGKLDLEKISRTNYNGLSGEIYFNEGRLAPVEVFQIINVIGKSHRELGFWSDGIGFFYAIGKTLIKKGSMDIFGQIFWPGGPSYYIPRGWEIPAITTPLRIGVPNNSMNNRFVKVTYNPSSNDYGFSGFSIDVFKETVQQLPYFLEYSFMPFNGTYNELVDQIRLKKFDAAVGDIAIVSERYKIADFTHPHTESGVVLVVPILSQSNKAWLFLKPFTTAMWFLTISINTYNGFVVWMIERNHYPDLNGSSLSQTRTFLCLAFGSLFSLHGEGLQSNLSRMATAVWLVVALIISQSYTASLASMLTVPRLEPRVSDIGALRYSNAVIGYSRKSFVRNYLIDVLHFNTNNMRNFSTIEDTAEALKSSKIAGAFLEFPTAKLMVAKYCKSFRIAGPMYKIGGYGYAFPKGSPLVSDIDEALMKVFESGVLKGLEDILTASEKCVDSIESDSNNNNEILSLSPSSFYVLFAWTVGTSTAALAFYAIHSKCGVDRVVTRALKHWGKQKRIFSRKVSYAENENPRNSEAPGSPHFAIAA